MKSEEKNRKDEKIKKFNPNEAADSNTIFGLPDFTVEEAELIIMPAWWAPTVSYRTGTEYAPSQILNSSGQIELYFEPYAKAWQHGIMSLSMQPNEEQIARTHELRARINELRAKKMSYAGSEKQLEQINSSCDLWMNQDMYREALYLFYSGKIPAVIGGDHSAPLGVVQAVDHVCQEQGKTFSMLQIDAHMDLRKSYEGLKFSHASAMYNYLKLNAMERLVQLGVRDFCEEEAALTREYSSRIKTFSNQSMKRGLYQHGRHWLQFCEEIADSITTQEVYVTIDMDGFDPKLCPNTGTPVPGGLEYDEFLYLMNHLVVSGKKIIGFDICETGVAEKTTEGTCYDTDVAARLLWQMSCYTLWSQHKNKKTEVDDKPLRLME